MPAIEIGIQQIKQRQTVVDYAVQNSGTMESLFEVAILNGVSITEDIAPGTIMLAPVVEKKTVEFYNKNAVDITTSQTNEASPGGIGYMQIGASFKVL
jgi:hypothetical protein